MTPVTYGQPIPDDDVDAALVAMGPEYGRLTVRLYYALEVLKSQDGSLRPRPLGPFRYTLARAWADAEANRQGDFDPAVGSLILTFDPEDPPAMEEWHRRTTEAKAEAAQWQQ